MRRSLPPDRRQVGGAGGGPLEARVGGARVAEASCIELVGAGRGAGKEQAAQWGAGSKDLRDGKLAAAGNREAIEPYRGAGGQASRKTPAARGGKCSETGGLLQ